ncbi:uncharacterized protein FOMMEDRAFT_16954 [Fomitiporia mediterranea MF3/22]|uniref:uncharacterized protein n=1 Tax=Fomitiporia mediterranea (strain MF3/22) TaxID=694068 RepID=UPI000440940E|nr:uncharacterized protein FOMMEDRAFT_16954 [Fomitiporia mediterranea MF3/22]EJD06349.1 hypothetical protein FOMMEDRAFT_16954 [Fomitiporia mediterranea MF3/22]
MSKVLLPICPDYPEDAFGAAIEASRSCRSSRNIRVCFLHTIQVVRLLLSFATTVPALTEATDEADSCGNPSLPGCPGTVIEIDIVLT